ncbi:hypothetical protein [Rhodoferax sp.]|nr:hypothetical protein [Rhodoferax sp.]
MVMELGSGESKIQFASQHHMPGPQVLALGHGKWPNPDERRH